MALALALLAWLYQGVRTLHTPQGDFVNHREWGRRFVAREFLYADGLNVPYPPFWAAAHAPLALMPPAVAWGVHLTLGCAALLTVTMLCHCLARAQFALTFTEWVCLHAAVLALLSRAILRDLQDGGANLMLLALVLLAVVAWTRERDHLGSAALGCAIALKCTAGLVLLWFLWRRQWRIAGWALLWTLLFSLSPLLWVDASNATFWIDNILKSVVAQDATRGILGPEEVRNVALRPTLARLISTPAATAALMAVLVVGAYRCRTKNGRLETYPTGSSSVGTGFQPVRPSRWGWEPLQQRTTPARGVLQQIAVVLLMTLLLSPITWNPHCVAALPALVCVLGHLCERSGRVQVALGLPLAFVAVALRTPLNPALVGGQIGGYLYIYGATTAGLVLLFLVVAAINPQRRVRAWNRNQTP